jgi:hypothetical protein
MQDMAQIKRAELQFALFVIPAQQQERALHFESNFSTQ